METLHLVDSSLQVNSPIFAERESLWNFSDLFGCTVRAEDGEIGKVHDLFFEEKSWAIQYVVVDLGDWALDTGKWISGQKVVVPIRACDQPVRATQVLRLSLSKEQVELSPPIEIYEQWLNKVSTCSIQQVINSYIKALDGDIGHVEDFIFDTNTWIISSMVVDTKNWWPAKKVLIAPLWIDRVDLIASTVLVDLPRDFIKSSPEFNRKAFATH
jgi:sporulation protein YlmC with PRC-barrel domain